MERDVALMAAMVADFVVAGGYVVAGALLTRRAFASSAPRAGAMFALWWFGNAATGLSTILLTMLALRGDVSLFVLDLTEQATLIFYAAALVGFTSYVAYIYLGSHRAEWVIVPSYAALVAWSVANVLAHPATGSTLQGWRPHLVREGGFGPPLALTASLLVVPLLIAVAAYASLFRTTPDREARYRIALVTATFVAWLVSVMVLSIPGLGGAPLPELAARAVILACTALIVLAYRPTPRLRAWFGHADARDHLARRQRALADRARDLV